MADGIDAGSVGAGDVVDMATLRTPCRAVEEVLCENIRYL